ncbi:MAG: hypothetical protein AAF471_09530 [Myxococcota bacterium]
MLACKLARRHGGTVTFVDLADFSIPLYNGDDEAKNGLPPGAARFKALVKQRARAAFGENGDLANEKDAAKLESVIERFLAPAAKQL